MTTVKSYYRGRGEGLVKPPGSHGMQAFSDHWCWRGPFNHTAAESSTLLTVTLINSLTPQARLGTGLFLLSVANAESGENR